MSYEHHTEALLTMQRALEAELATLGIHDPHNVSNWVAVPSTHEHEADPNDAADMIEELEERESTLAALETRWNDIRRALKKMESGTYGLCEISGNPIEEERLVANPAARTCIQHMEEESSLPQ